MMFQYFKRFRLSPNGMTGAMLITGVLSGSVAMAGPTVAEFHNGTWSPQVTYDTATIRVSGPEGYVHQETVSAGQIISISSVNLADGQYSYELKLFENTYRYVGPDHRNVTPEEIDGNGRARDMQDRTGEVTVYEQSGGFQVKGGSIIWNPRARE